MASCETKFACIATNEQLADYCGVSWDELRMLAYADRVKRYTEWLVPKRNGEGYRRISSPMANLRRVQQAIARGLSEYYSPPDCVYGFVRGRNVAMNALQHTKKKVVLTLDLEDFFPSITASRVHGLFEKVYKIPTPVVNTLTNLVSYNGSLPQGAPTSPILSNIICFKMDRSFLNFAANNGLTYTRYADDLVFSSTSAYSSRLLFDQKKSGIEGVSDYLIGVIEANGFRINARKVHIANNGSRQLVNGIVVNKKCNIKRKLYREFRALFYRWRTEGYSSAFASYFENKQNSHYKDRIIDDGKPCDEATFVRHIRGRLDYYSMVISANGRPTDPMARLWTQFHEITRESVPYLTYEKSAVQLSYVYDSEKDEVPNAAESSGVIVCGILITCSHGLPKESFDKNGDNVLVEIRTPFNGRFSLKASSFIKYPDLDFAYAPLERECIEKGVRLINSAYIAQAGERIVASGYAGGNTPSYSVQASVLPGCSRNGNVVVDRAFIRGMSGGPVFNTRHEVIGIVLKGSGESSYSKDGEYLPFNVLSDLEPFVSLMGSRKGNV